MRKAWSDTGQEQSSLLGYWGGEGSEHLISYMSQPVNLRGDSSPAGYSRTVCLPWESSRFQQGKHVLKLSPCSLQRFHFEE
ncbi:hypothetical protein Q5P01_021834 [Channa striata]|uniref:Uncharacterized protein n=1 Tax=Channa striata TaxID=64152 RepID=A0AA88LUU6_CHASR|nr:hypothetical protein Q5P01_021834 [Channa striata]